MKDLRKLYEFFEKAGGSTYAGGGKYERTPERAGFYELVYEEGDLHYRDSYTGFYRSRGTETIRHKGSPIWVSLYGGGMVEGREDLADETFSFLKKSMLEKTDGFMSMRGPKEYKNGNFKYRYHQEGDMEEFFGYEEILLKEDVVFFHRTMGGIIRGKEKGVGNED